MQEFNITGKTKITAEIKAQLDDSPLVSPIGDGTGSVDDLGAFSESINQAGGSFKETAALMKEFGNILPELIKNLKAMNSSVAETNQQQKTNRRVRNNYNGSNADELIRQNLVNVANLGNNVVQSIVHENIAGAVSSVLSGGANSFRAGGKLAKDAGNEGLGNLLGGVGTALSVITAVVNAGNALAEKYEQEMPIIYGTGKAFGNLSDSGAMSIYGQLNQYNKNTGLDIGDFHSVAQSLRRQGVGNGLGQLAAVDLVGNIAQTTSRWAYQTGGSAEQYAEFAGMMARYGGSKNVSSDFNKIISAGYASGLNDVQIPEFLSGIQKVMEDGIAKGFTRSSTEVADTLLMFSKMSGGNQLFKGEQGAKLLNQINSGIAGATGLSKTEDILVYGAFAEAYKDKDIKGILNKTGNNFVEGANYVNMMQLIERGINADNWWNIRDTLDSSYGGDTDAKIEALRKMTGLNYSGAAALYNMERKQGESEQEFEARKAKIMNAPENKNLETRNAESLNAIHEAVVQIAQKPFELKVSGQELFGEGLKGITKFLNMSFGDKYIEGMTTSLTDAQKLYFDENKEYFFDPKKIGLDAAIENMETLSNWSGVGIPEFKHRSDAKNSLYENTRSMSRYDSVVYGKVDEGYYINPEKWAWESVSGDKKKRELFFRELFGQRLLDTGNGKQSIDVGKLLENAEKDSSGFKSLYKAMNDVLGNGPEGEHIITDKEMDRIYDCLVAIANNLGEGVFVTESSNSSGRF